MNNGAVLMGLGALGILAFFFGGEAEAAEKHPTDKWISESDTLGKAEAGELQGYIDQALKACPGLSNGDMGDCDPNALKDIAYQIRQVDWKHAEVKEVALAQADKLDELAASAAEVGKVYGKEVQKLQAHYAAKDCTQPTKACVTKLYNAAYALESYQWQTPVGAEALKAADNLRAQAKAIEDAIAQMGQG
jgi:hypothetical protein